jgi:hypothetical protein
MSNRIFVFNKSSVLKNTDMFLMINAINVMLPAFCKTWSLKECTCIAAPSNTKPGTNGMYCVFLDHSTSPGTLAFHTEYDNIPYGEIFVKTVLQYGGSVLMGANRTVPTVAQAFSHEIFEMLVNPNVNVWWQTSNTTLVPAEVCDPVQGMIVPIKVGSVMVGLSDYIFPEWNDPQSKKGPYHFLNTLRRPFQMARGGYLIYMKSGVISFVYGNSVTSLTQDRLQNELEFITAKYQKTAEPIAELAALVEPVTVPVAQ